MIFVSDVERVVWTNKQQKKTTHEMTPLRYHVISLYVITTLCFMTLVACSVFIHDLRHRQSMTEQKFDFIGGEEGCSCRCCHLQETPRRKSTRLNQGQGSLPENTSTSQESQLSSDLKAVDSNAVESVSSRDSTSLPVTETAPVLPAVEAEFDRAEFERLEPRQGRIRRDVGLSKIQNSNSDLISTSSAIEARTEADLGGSASFDLSTVSADQVDESTAETVDVTSSIRHGLRHPRHSTEDPDSDPNARNNRKRQKTPRNDRRSKSEKMEKHSKKSDRNWEHHLAAIHLQAPEHFDRRYESGPVISLNASNTRDTVYRFWQKASWVEDSASAVFHLDDVTGHVTVEIEGIYLIYAQVVYHDLSGRWSFGIYVGDQERVKCLATEQLKDLHNYHPTSHGVYHSCYTALVLHIRKNQSVSIKCLYGSRTILTRPEFTFWGIVRLS